VCVFVYVVAVDVVVVGGFMCVHVYRDMMCCVIVVIIMVVVGM